MSPDYLVADGGSKCSCCMVCTTCMLCGACGPSPVLMSVTTQSAALMNVIVLRPDNPPPA